MRWVKGGLIYKPKGQFWWNKSHAAVPTVDLLDDKRWRIYFGARDNNNRSHISYIEVEAGNPQNILYEHHEPILSLGKLGTFDDCGLMPSWIIDVGNKKFLYYIGWAVRNTIPYHNSIGLAISTDGGTTYERFSHGPLFGTTVSEPHFTASSCFLVEGGMWRGWYLSCTQWRLVNGRPEPFYHIKYAQSVDGIHWERPGTIAIDYKSESEGGISRPSVLKEMGIYRMWYSCRGHVNYRTDQRTSYRIGYAESSDGIRWTRIDDFVGIDVSPEGWDSEMIEYPHVIVHAGKKYMFYNGNKFGESGFGYAELSPA